MQKLQNDFTDLLGKKLAMISAIERLLDRLCPSVLVLSGEHPAYDSSIWVKTARRRGIRTAVIPQIIFSPQEQALFCSAYPDKFGCSVWQNKVTAMLFPDWAMEYEGGRYIRLFAHEILVKVALDVSPARPWMPGSGFADCLLLESKAMYEYAVKEGLDPARMKVTGSICHDIMFEVMTNREAHHAKLIRQYGLNPKLPTVITAAPPDMFYVCGHRCVDFKDNRELLTYWMKTLAADGECNVLISIHPTDRPEDFAYLKQWGAQIISERLYQVLPLADLFVTTVSATIQWAIATGIPTINYDVYRCRYTDYLSEPGVLTIESKSEFEEVYNALVARGERYKVLQQSQRSRMDEWGRLDGQCAGRILSGIEKLIAERIGEAEHCPNRLIQNDGV